MNKIPNRQAICDTLMKSAAHDPDITELYLSTIDSYSLLNFKTHIRKANPRMCVFSLFLHLAVDNARGFVIDWR